MVDKSKDLGPKHSISDNSERLLQKGKREARFIGVFPAQSM